MTPPKTALSPLRRGDGAALWKQIADALERDIKAGHFDDDDGRLPTERELTDRFGVNRHTVRRALSALAETGMVRTEQGRGAFVNVELVEYPLGRRVRFSESLRAQSLSPEGRVLEVIGEQAAADVAAALKIRKGAKVWRVDRIGSIEDRPVVLGTHYFEYARFPNMDADFQADHSVTAVLKTYGVNDYERRETRILARPATAEETRLLDLVRGRPVLVTEGVNVDADGEPIEYGVARFAADRVQLLA